MRKVIALIVAGLFGSACHSQSFDMRSPVPLFVSSSDLKKMRIKSLSIQTYSYDDPENYSEQHLYGIDKAGRKLFFLLKMYKGKEVVEGGQDTTFFTKEKQTGYECSEKSETNDVTKKEVCDSNHRILTRGTPDYGNFELYEYDENGKIKNEYFKLSRVDRVPIYKKRSYQYDKLNRLNQIIYYEGNISDSMEFDSDNPFKSIVFKLSARRNIYFVGASQQVKYIEDYDNENKLKSILYYHYSKSGLPSHIEIYELSPKKRVVAKSQFRYTYY